MQLQAIRPRLISCRRIDDVSPALGAALVGDSFDGARHRCLGLVTADQDDSTYIALDEATKHADVDVVFGRSFYAGAAHASGPLSGEVLGVVAGADPDDVAEALWVIKTHLAEVVCFQTFAPSPSSASSSASSSSPAFLAHVIGETGTSLSKQAGIAAGEPMAYLIAPPIEAAVAVDAALKAAPVRLLQFIAAPSETNFSGAFLGGTLADLEAARDAFVAAIFDVTSQPLKAARRPDRLRR
jgi:ethanolamine utilization protein EutL